MADTNGAGEEPGLVLEREPDPRPVEADQLVRQLRDHLAAAAAERQQLSEDVAAVRTERSEVAKLKASAKAAIERATAAEKQVETNATQAATAATQAKACAAAAQKHAESISTTNDTIKTTLGGITTNAKTIADHRSRVEEDAEATAALARKAESVEGRIKKYEDGFDERNKRADALAERVESLLPGATSAGLADSFLTSRESKNRPRMWWLSLFLVSMGMLAWSLFWKLPWQSSTETTAAINWLYLLGRVPIVAIFGTVAWVALVYFRIESRMQDDYRHKQNLAATYDGFRKLMSEEKPDGSPASYDLAQQTLAAIHAPPGRMYENKGEVHTPAEGLVHAIADRVADMLKQKPDGK
jgi:hypothetical protein